MKSVKIRVDSGDGFTGDDGDGDVTGDKIFTGDITGDKIVTGEAFFTGEIDIDTLYYTLHSSSFTAHHR